MPVEESENGFWEIGGGDATNEQLADQKAAEKEQVPNTSLGLREDVTKVEPDRAGVEGWDFNDGPADGMEEGGGPLGSSTTESTLPKVGNEELSDLTPEQLGVIEAQKMTARFKDQIQFVKAILSREDPRMTDQDRIRAAIVMLDMNLGWPT